MVVRPGPGRPDTEFTAAAPVGPTQKTAPSVGFEVSAIGASAIPTAVSVLVPFLPEKPPVKKQLRLAETQLPTPPPQSASTLQPR